MLTYRVLTLTEGLPLSPGRGHERVLRALAGVYAGSQTAGHRLLSLATELARYYRAVRASYKYKVDEEGKPWAVRAIKNRSYRRLAFVSSALHFAAAGPRIDYRVRKLFDLDEVASFMGSMRETPSVRLLEALTGLEVDPEAVGRVLVIYEQIHSALASAETRRTLDGISAPDRFGHPVYEPLRTACAALHTSLAQLILGLPRQPRQELVEMFLL